MLKRSLDAVTNVTAYGAGACVVLMMIHITVDVICRAFLNLPLTGTITFVANYYMVFLVCLPLAFVERLDAHISVDVVTGRLPERWRRHLYGMTYPVTALIFGVSGYATWIEAMSKYRIRSFVIEKDIAIPIWYGYFALPVGYSLLCAYLLLKFVAYLSGQTLEPLRLDDGDEMEGVLHD